MTEINDALTDLVSIRIGVHGPAWSIVLELDNKRESNRFQVLVAIIPFLQATELSLEINFLQRDDKILERWHCQ